MNNSNPGDGVKIQIVGHTALRRLIDGDQQLEIQIREATLRGLARHLESRGSRDVIAALNGGAPWKFSKDIQEVLEKATDLAVAQVMKAPAFKKRIDDLITAAVEKAVTKQVQEFVRAALAATK